MTGKTSSMLDYKKDIGSGDNAQLAKSSEGKILAYIGKHAGCSMQDIMHEFDESIGDIPVYIALHNLVTTGKIKGESPYESSSHKSHTDYTYTLKGKKGYTLISSKIRGLALSGIRLADTETPGLKTSDDPYTLRDPLTHRRRHDLRIPDKFRKEPSETPRTVERDELGEVVKPGEKLKPGEDSVESWEKGKWVLRRVLPKTKHAPFEPKKHPVKIPQKTPGLQPSEEEVRERVKKAGYREKSAVIRNIAKRSLEALEE